MTGCGGAENWRMRADVVVIGTGVAGLAAALAAHRRGRKVIVLSKAAETATFYAQGGIAVVLPDALRDGDDSVDAHVAGSLAAVVLCTWLCAWTFAHHGTASAAAEPAGSRSEQETTAP